MDNIEKNNLPPEQEGSVVPGTVIEALPNTLFKVKMAGDKEIIAYLSGKMRMHRIKVVVGDNVEMFCDDYGSRARITKRL